jgi:hypothetical protein
MWMVLVLMATISCVSACGEGFGGGECSSSTLQSGEYLYLRLEPASDAQGNPDTETVPWTGEGASLNVSRDEGLVTLRYTRDGQAIVETYAIE